MGGVTGALGPDTLLPGLSHLPFLPVLLLLSSLLFPPPSPCLARLWLAAWGWLLGAGGCQVKRRLQRFRAASKKKNCTSHHSEPTLIPANKSLPAASWEHGGVVEIGVGPLVEYDRLGQRYPTPGTRTSIGLWVIWHRAA